MKTVFVIAASVSILFLIAYFVIRLVLCAVIIYADNLKRKGLNKKS